MTAIAIDFGTSRTKLAYLLPGAAKPDLMRLGDDEQPFLPSLFYLSPDSEQILWGSAAAEMLEEDPAGVIDVLKRQLRTPYVRRGGAKRRRERPADLLALLFTKLREKAGREIPAFASTLPEQVILTLPALYGPPDEQVLKAGAEQAGFSKIELVPEPVAAARAWLAETGAANQDVIVLDCGGGTIDWAYLKREQGDFRVVPQCPPGGDRNVGGHDVDEELLNLVRDKLGAEAEEEIKERKTYYLAQVRRIKERYCRGLPLPVLKVAGQQITFSVQEIQAVFEERFINQVCTGLKSYLTRVTEETKGALPLILLVGGSARLKGLKEAIEERLGCQTAWWERSEYATVLGAVPIPASSPRPSLERQTAQVQYRTVVEMAWADQQLNATECERLAITAERIGLTKEDAAVIEQEVMGETAQAILARNKLVPVVSPPKETTSIKPGEVEDLQEWVHAHARQEQVIPEFGTEKAKEAPQVVPPTRHASSTQQLEERNEAPAERIRSSDSLVVSAHDEGDFTTISAALRAARPGATIRVRPGVYHEGLIIDKSVTIAGDGPCRNIVVESTDASCILMQTDKAAVQGLTLHCCEGESSNKECFAVDIPRGRLILAGCDITSDSLCGVNVHGTTADAVISHCQVHQCKKVGGIVVKDRARATIRDCTVVANSFSGIYVRDGATAAVQNCTINDNGWDGVHILGGTAVVRQCRVNQNKHWGIRVTDNGVGTVEGCDLSGNSDGECKAESGLAIHGWKPAEPSTKSSERPVREPANPVVPPQKNAERNEATAKPAGNDEQPSKSQQALSAVQRAAMDNYLGKIIPRLRAQGFTYTTDVPYDDMRFLAVARVEKTRMGSSTKEWVIFVDCTSMSPLQIKQIVEKCKTYVREATSGLGKAGFGKAFICIPVPMVRDAETASVVEALIGQPSVQPSLLTLSQLHMYPAVIEIGSNSLHLFRSLSWVQWFWKSVQKDVITWLRI